MTATSDVEQLLTACRAKANLYSPKEVEFLRSVSTQHTLTGPQMEWLTALAERERLDFEKINGTALPILLAVCQRWLPDGVLYGKEYVARNPTRSDAKPGSFRINVNTGRWADFAVPEARGGDPISLAAYLFHSGDQVAAAKDVKRMVGL